MSERIEKSKFNPSDYGSRVFCDMAEEQREEWTPKGQAVDDYVLNVNENMNQATEGRKWKEITVLTQANRANVVAEPQGPEQQVDQPQEGEEESREMEEEQMIRAEVQNKLLDVKLTAEDFLNDTEFKEMFSYLKDGTLPQSEEKARVTLLLAH